MLYIMERGYSMLRDILGGILLFILLYVFVIVMLIL